jgi:YD repeat-containing protein
MKLIIGLIFLVFNLAAFSQYAPPISDSTAQAQQIKHVIHTIYLSVNPDSSIFQTVYTYERGKLAIIKIDIKQLPDTYIINYRSYNDGGMLSTEKSYEYHDSVLTDSSEYVYQYREDGTIEESPGTVPGPAITLKKDADGKVLERIAESQTSVIRTEYTYDSKGNRTSEKVFSDDKHLSTETFLYDEKSRMIRTERSLHNTEIIEIIQIEYDLQSLPVKKSFLTRTKKTEPALYRWEVFSYFQ